MIYYCYTTENGDWNKALPFPCGKAPNFIILDDGRRARRDYRAEHPGAPKVKHRAVKMWPMWDVTGLGVNPASIASTRTELAKKGVHAEFRDDGAVKLNSRAHRSAMMKARGMKDLDGGYGDYTGR